MSGPRTYLGATFHSEGARIALPLYTIIAIDNFGLGLIYGPTISCGSILGPSPRQMYSKPGNAFVCFFLGGALADVAETVSFLPPPLPVQSSKLTTA